MTQHSASGSGSSRIKLFETREVRSLWDAEQELWFFSIVDVVAVLTESPNARKYWSVLKTRLKKEGSELATNCSQLKMQSADGKKYLTDVASTEISQQRQPDGFEESRVIAAEGGKIAGDTRKAIEAKSGKAIVTSRNAKELGKLPAKK